MTPETIVLLFFVFLILLITIVALSILTHLKLKEIIMNQEQHAAELLALKEQNDKARAEVLQKIADLEAAVGQTTPEVDAAFAALKASVQTDDDIVPDPEP